MFKRIYTYLRGLIFGKLDQWENPEVILDTAVREMKEGQVRNRERAVQAITQKNNLANLVDKEEKVVRDLEAQAELALKRGDRELARTVLREKSQREGALDKLRASLKAAEETAEAIKTAMRREDEQLRVKTADALRLKANMKSAQIQIEINKALEGLTFEDNSVSFNRAEERINSMQAEADARAEISRTNVNSRLMSLSDAQVDADADRQLAEMEARMGLGATSSVSVNGSNTSAAESDIDRQLRELEQKLGQKT